MKNKFTLLIHGGAGYTQDPPMYEESVINILNAGKEKLSSGASAMDVVEFVVCMLEDDPIFNAGRGSVLNSQGIVEMDAGIMDGATLQFGAVASITGVAHPVSVARRVIDKSDHVLLGGAGARQFAEKQGFSIHENNYFVTEFRAQQLKKAQAEDVVVLDHSSTVEGDKKFGTVGAVAMDMNGNIAAGTSTGGIVNKKWGRIGDAPVVGSGTYADNSTIAVSATGYGEHFMRTSLAKYMADLKEMEKVPTKEIAARGIKRLVEAIDGKGGVIVVDASGGYSSDFSTHGMIHGMVTESVQPTFKSTERLKG